MKGTGYDENNAQKRYLYFDGGGNGMQSGYTDTVGRSLRLYGCYIRDEVIDQYQAELEE